MLLKLHFKTLFFWHSIFLSAKHVNFLHIQTAAFAPLSWVFYANSELFRIFAFFGFCVASNNLSAVTQERSLQVFVQYLLFPIQYLFHIHCILSVLLPTLLNNNCSFKNPFLYIMFTSLHFDIYLPNILYHTSKWSVKFKSEQIRTVALLYNTHPIKHTDFWNIKKEN